MGVGRGGQAHYGGLLQVLIALGEFIRHVLYLSACRNVGTIANLSPQLARQLHADIGMVGKTKALCQGNVNQFPVFLTEALVDLRVEPSPRLSEFASKLKKACG